MYEFLQYVENPDVTAQDVVTLLTEPITSLETTGFEFPGIAVLFDLWFQFFQQGELFSPSAVEDRASLDVRFGKEEGFFTQVVSDAIIQSLLTSLMKGKVPDSFDTFDVFGSILKFVAKQFTRSSSITIPGVFMTEHSLVVRLRSLPMNNEERCEVRVASEKLCRKHDLHSF